MTRVNLMPTAAYLLAMLDYNPDTGAFTWTDAVSMLRPAKKRRPGGDATSPHPIGYKQIWVPNCGVVLAHRLAFLYETGRLPPKGWTVDHENGIRDDNRFDNLRIASCSQNSANSKKGRGNYPKGVSKGSKNRFRSTIRFQRKFLYIGSFKTVEEAAKAYQVKALELQGQFARFR